MPQTFDSRRLRHQRQMDRRLTADHRQIALLIAGLVLRAATTRDATGRPVIAQSRTLRDALKAAIWESVLKPYYIGPGTDALRGAAPQSPYARLLVDGIEKATRIQAERQTAIARRLCKDPVVLQWLLGTRPFLAVREMAPVGISGRITELTAINVGSPFTPLPARGSGRTVDVSRLVSPRGMYDAFHQWVDPNGYRLSDRIWRTSIDVRARVDRLLDYEIARGTSAVQIADLLEPFLTPGALRQRTQAPYGSEGSFAARRLARTEITAAAGRATVNAAAANPFVERLQWRTSGSHPKPDVCDANTRGGPNGDGIYAIGEVPPYPSHPHCLCHLLPVPTSTTADLVSSLRADIQAARGDLVSAASGGNAQRARNLQGILNPDYLTRAIMSGSLEDAILAAVRGVLA